MHRFIGKQVELPSGEFGTLTNIVPEDVATLSGPRGIVKILDLSGEFVSRVVPLAQIKPVPPVAEVLKTFTYSEALNRIKQDKLVSCTRWGLGGKVYVKQIYSNIDGYRVPLLVLTDTTRDTVVAFTPSVENQLQDEWYEV